MVCNISNLFRDNRKLISYYQRKPNDSIWSMLNHDYMTTCSKFRYEILVTNQLRQMNLITRLDLLTSQLCENYLVLKSSDNNFDSNSCTRVKILLHNLDFYHKNASRNIYKIFHMFIKLS